MTTFTNSIIAIPLTMSSREIAELTGKHHAHVMRDIRAMLEQVGEGQSKFGSTYFDAQGKERDCYNLPKNLTLTLIAGYRADMRLKIIDRWIELETNPSTEIQTEPSFDKVFEQCLRIASHFSQLDENQRLLSASRGTKELSGINPMEIMGITSLAAPTQDNYMTPTEIGKEIGMGAVAVNRLLTSLGMQVKSVGSSTSSSYTMTRQGEKFGRMFDTTRRHGKGSQQQLKWSPDLVGVLRSYL